MGLMSVFKHTTRARALALFAALQLFALRAFAQLPTQADPDSGTIRAGNIIDAVKFYAKDCFSSPASSSRPSSSFSSRRTRSPSTKKSATVGGRGVISACTPAPARC